MVWVITNLRSSIQPLKFYDPRIKIINTRNSFQSVHDNTASPCVQWVTFRRPSSLGTRKSIRQRDINSTGSTALHVFGFLGRRDGDFSHALLPRLRIIHFSPSCPLPESSHSSTSFSLELKPIPIHEIAMRWYRGNTHRVKPSRESYSFLGSSLRSPRMFFCFFRFLFGWGKTKGRKGKSTKEYFPFFCFVIRCCLAVPEVADVLVFPQLDSALRFRSKEILSSASLSKIIYIQHNISSFSLLITYKISFFPV